MSLLHFDDRQIINEMLGALEMDASLSTSPVVPGILSA
jgi:hypothetical protein